MNRNSLPAKRSNWFDRIAGWIAQPAEGLIRRGVSPQSPDPFPARSQEEENIERWMGWIDDTVTNTVAGAIDIGKDYASNMGIPVSEERTLIGSRVGDEEKILSEIVGLGYKSALSGDTVYLRQDLEEIEKVFYKYGYGVPDIFSSIISERQRQRPDYKPQDWELHKLIIDPTNREGIQQEVNDLRNRGYEKVDSSIPYIKYGPDEDAHGKPIGRDTGLYIEQWGKPKGKEFEDTGPIGQIDALELKGAVRETLRQGKPPENAAEMLGKMGLTIAASLPTAGLSAITDPGMQAQGGLIQFDTDSDFEAVINTLEFASPTFTTIFGPADNYIVPIWRQWKASRGGLSGVFHSKRRAALNLKAFDPSADLEEIGESAVDTRQSLLDSGIPEKEADLSTRMMIQVGNNLKGEPTLFTDLININRVSDGVANSAFEESVRNPDMFVPQGYLFQVGDQEPRNILGFKHNFDDWIDWADAHGEGKVTSWRRKTRDFDADALLKHLQDPGQRNVAVNPLFGRYSGMKLSSEELSSLGVYRFLEENSKKRVSIEDLRGYMDQNRIHISEVYMPDLYDSWNLSANLQGPVDRSGVMLLKLDLERMDDNHPLIQELMPRWSGADPDDVPRNLQGEMAGHYSAKYDAEFGSNVSEIRARFENLITGGVGEGKVPLSARQNMFMHARYQVRKDASGNLVFHIDEIQSDAFQKSMPYSDTDFANSIFDSILAPDNVNVPLFWQSKNLDGRQLPYHWMTGILARNKKDRKGRMEYFDPSTDQYDSAEIEIVDYFIAPANEAASTDDVVMNQYQSIVNSLITDSNGLRDDLRILQVDELTGNPDYVDISLIDKKGNKRRNPLNIREETHIIVAPDHEYGLGRNFSLGTIQVQVIDPVPGVAGGIDKAPVIRIAHNIPDTYDPTITYDDREGFLGRAIDKIFSRTGIFATRARGVVGEPSRIRWSIDDVINNKVPGYRIKKYKDNGVEKYKIQEGMTESPVGILTTGKRTVREWADGFETEKSAAIALLQYFNKAEGNPYDFPLPPNFLFNITNFHKPVLRRMMFHGAGENAEFVTISTGDSLNNRYEGAALPYSDNNYGTASVNGMEAPNYIDADGNKVRRGKFVDDASQIITDIMRTAGWSGWTNKDSNMLIRATNLPSGTSLSSRKNVEDAVSAASRGGFLEDNSSLPVSIIPVLNDADEIINYIPGTYAHSFRDKIIRLGNNLGDMGAPWSSLEIISGDFSVEKLRPGMWDEVIDDIDYRPYQVVPLSQDDAVLNALRNVTRQELEDQLNAAGDISLIADTLRDDLNHLIGSRGTIKHWEREIKEHIYGISNLFEPSAVGGGGFRLPPGERGIRTINGLPAVRLPEIMSIPGKDELSILDFLEIEGLQSGHLPNGSSTSDILNALTELAVKVPGSDINTTVLDKSIGAKPLASLIDRPTDKVVPVHAIMLKDNLLDRAVRTKLGITAVPDNELTSRRSLQEALTEVQMRLFQANGDIPKGGKVLGFTDFTNDGRYLIRLTSAANFKTVMHEFAHVFRRHLSEDQLRIAGEFSMGKQQFGKLTNKNIWTRAGEEKFAEAFEEYLEVGAYPEGMQGVFERLKDMLLNVARAIKGTPHEEALSPAMRDLFDNLLNTKKTSTRQIQSALPNHMHPQAFKFYGHRVDNYTVADTGDIETGGRLFSTSDEPQVRPLVEELSSVSDIEDVLTANMIDNNYTNIMKTLPIVRNILKRIDPSAAATDPLTRGMIAHAMVSSEGLQKSQIAFSRLNRLGKQSDVFGDLDDKGLLMGDEVHPKLRGLTLNTVRTNVKYRPYLSPKQTEWVDTINGIEDGRLAMLKAEGIEVNELVFEEGGRYGGRTVMGKVFADGSTMATIVVGGEEGRLPTAKRGFEKRRRYDFAEEAIEDGFRYLEEDETVLRGLQGAYQRVADKKFVDYVVKNVVWTRTSQAPDEITKRRAIADKRYDAAKNLLTQLQDAKRGKQIPWQTRKSIETILPEVEGMLDDVSQITLEQLIKAGRVAADQPIDATPRKGAVKALFNRVKELENEINTIKASGEEVPSELVRRLNKMKRDLGFTKFKVREAYKNFEETGTFEYNFERAALGILMEDKVGAIDKLLDIVRGTPYIKTLESGATITKHRGGLISDLGQESFKINKEYEKAKEYAKTVRALEGTAGTKIPALSGKIFTEKQPTNLGFIKDKTTGKMRPIVGQDVSEKIIRSLIEDTRGSEWLNTVNTYNSAMRFFRLAGDMSMIGIQLLFLTGHAVRHPSFLPRVIKAYVHAFIDPTVHAKILDNNRELLNNHPGMMLSASGTEFTDFPRVISDAGFVRAKPVQMIGEAASYVPGLPQTGRGYMRFLVGAQQGFEAALDTAGIELLKTIDHLAVDAKSTQEIDDFINEFRGLANPSRLGITAKQRQVETLMLLAPRYNRAIAAMMFDVVRGNIRGSQARRKLASSFAAISAMGVAFSLAQGEEPEDIVEHFKPHSPKFMTWDVGGANIGFGSKVRSLMKLTGNIYMQEDDNGNLPDASMWDILSSNPGFKFLRGNASPVIGSGIDFISGRTYMGEPLHGDQFLSLQTLERTAVSELLPMTMPIWASSVLLERGNAVQRATRGVSEFLGGRGYPESSYQIMQRFASDTLEIDYEDLEPFERKMLRDTLVDVIGPIMAERVINGDKTAKYYSELDQLDKDRLARETQLLHQFMNHRQYPQFAGSGAARLLNTEFFRIQSEYAIYRQMLNEQYGMYQDDADYDADEVNKYIMQEWYKLYERAEDPKTGYFNSDYLENLQNEFWKRKVPSDFDEAGTKFSNYQDYIYRNTSSTEHPKEFSFYLPKKTVARWERAKSLRAEFLANRGNWGKVLDNQQ